MADIQLNQDGEFFTLLRDNIGFSNEEIKTMNGTVAGLLANNTDASRPGMLLGKIQSGKTRSFMGSMALGFDNGYEIAIILTKTSNALVKQTFERIEREFSEVIDDDKLEIFDVINLPDKLTRYELDKKIVILAKKETKNMDRLYSFLFEQYPYLATRKLMFIDDEADYASVVYENNKDANITELKVIAKKIDTIRQKLSSASYLQVTATPYSLYLQPDDSILNARGYQPTRPAFTELVPIHDKYIGGEFYFEKSKEEGHIASYLYQSIDEDELDLLKKADNRRVKDDTLLTSKGLTGIRNALINFIVGSSIRRVEQKVSGQRVQKYAFIMHTITTKAAHNWQSEILERLRDKLTEIIDSDPLLFNQIIKVSYDDFERSKGDVDYFPVFKEILDEVTKVLKLEQIVISTVNSEKDVSQLLNKEGQLRLRNPLNLFVGGQILDRGITIGNLIGFYYGRNPQKFQQDTVLQHSRMYGARPIEDLTVTRFYTTQKIYEVMERMHHFDSDLRKAFELGANESEVVFVMKDDKNRIIPCNPNKIALSTVITLKKGKRFLPVGFHTKSKTELASKMKKIDKFIEMLKDTAIQVDPQDNRNILVSSEKVKELLVMIDDTLIMEENNGWDLESYMGILNYLSKINSAEKEEKIWIVLRYGKDISRMRGDGNGFIDSPETGHDEGKIAKTLSKELPVLILLEEQGREEKGWRGGRFYWPVLIAQQNIQTTVFSK
ncbi:hypothetical protein KFV05_02485 [Macrococcoides canis]|uniref:Z1 domain-containing protein n=1 Tax=Macrococcoides canis TaxID=1855823 RepID=UPI0020B75D58|nr:Z1 domain-containing protein [Macrococcus canis]UTH02876.1 hypothetical protein KFV05_02485 [Macrococcus canis]